MRLQLSLQCSGLENVCGLFRKSHPYAKVSLTNGDVVGHTETSRDNLNPNWSTFIHLDFEPNTELWITVSVHADCSGKRDDIDMGQVLVNVNKVYKSSLECETEKMSFETCTGSLILTAQEANETSERIHLQVRCLNVVNIELGRLGLGHTDPFLEISKKYNSKSAGTTRWQLIYRTIVIKNHLNPLWGAFDLSMGDFCDSDLGKLIKIELWDYQRKGQHRYLGKVETTTRQLLKSKTEKGNGDKTKALTFTNDTDYEGKRVGDLIILKAEINHQVTQ